jgi:hypothetical protein
MRRVNFPKSLVFILLTSISVLSYALSLDDISNQDANSGLKAALNKSATMAVDKLGVDNGFLNNPKVKIPLPKVLEQARPILQMTGKSQQLDDLVVAMNHAAESAVPLAKPLFIDAVKSMTLTDAKNILSGGDTSVTDFFKQKTSTQLTQKFQPIVKKVTDKQALSGKYDNLMGMASKMGAVSGSEATVDGYVTQRALDGLFMMIGEEEKAIRKDPVGAGSSIISKVFGALK